MLRIVVLFGCILSLLLPTVGNAEDVVSQTWKVEGKLVGKDDKKAKDISGIACDFVSTLPRHCLVIDDNIQAAQAVVLQSNALAAGEMVPLIDDVFDGKSLELDGEGIAFHDGAFYVIGSHGYPRDKDHKLDPQADQSLIAARIKAASQVVKIIAQADGTLVVQKPTMSLTKAIAAQVELAPFFGKRLDENGLTIEGIAIKGDRLFAGFREPVLEEGRTPILSVSLDGLAKDGDQAAKLFKIPLGSGMGVRDIAIEGDHFLILAGPVADVPGKYSIYSWDGVTDDGITPIVSLTDVEGAGDQRKAEALLPIIIDKMERRLLIMFDGEKEGSPLFLRIVNK
jgi:hypothetical protein